MLSVTVSQGNEVYFWKTMPRSLPGPETGWPFTSTSPWSGRSSPAIMRSSVDLPQPEGPSSTRNSPISRPSAEYASSTSKLTSSSALIFSPCGEKNVRARLRTVILDFLTSMFHRLQMRAGRGHRSCGSCGRELPPRKELLFKQGEQPAKEEGRKANGDDAGIDQVRTMKLLCRLHHGSHAILPVHNLGQDHVCPANVIQDAK